MAHRFVEDCVGLQSDDEEFGAIHRTLFIYHPLPAKSRLINKDPRTFLDSA